MIRQDPLSRLVSKLQVNPETRCWEFTGRIDDDGYGRIKVAGKNRKAYRVMFELSVGPLGPGEEVDHCCQNRRCCNPHHLEAVSSHENKLRISRPERRTSTYIPRTLALVPAGA